ncbi:MAG: hypothetical protein JO064_12265 [Actinobacteria bacterium]|nr:hypothetical protein [Actinomycetota bacterium]MBV8599183.1 hypothetical protein [Actinomycetota bacterium]
MLASVNGTYTEIVTSVFSSTIAAKVWFASAAGFFALVQLTAAARIFGKLKPLIPWSIAGAPMNVIHRWSGRLAFVCTLPVAFHCVFILGFQTANARVLAHSIVGSFFYGVFAVKVFAVRERELPGWVLPVVGGTVFAVLATLWLTSAFWYFTSVRVGF